MTGGMLAGKVAVVTGAADGMGRGIVGRFCEEGAQVLATDIAAEKLVAAHGNNPSVRCVAVDITAPGAAEQIIGGAVAGFGKLNILVNAAGIFRFESFADVTAAGWIQMMDINLNAPFHLCMRAIPELKQAADARIINITSTNAYRGRDGMGPYTVSKHGLMGLTTSLAVELGPFGITANSIAPGCIVTGITRHLVDSDPTARQDMENQGVLKRMGTVDEIAQAALYLAGPHSGFTTGLSLIVDGGFLVKYPERVST